MNRKKLFLTSLPLILIVIALVAGFVFFPQSFDLRNKASVARPTVAPRPEGTAQMLMLQDVTKDTDETQSFDVYFNGAYKPDAQVSSFETQITVKSQNGQVLGDTDSALALVATQEPSIPPTKPTTIVTRPDLNTSISKITCNPQNPSTCGYGSKCVAGTNTYYPAESAPNSTAPTAYFCTLPSYCFNWVTTQSGKLSWNGCKGPTQGAGACLAAFFPLSESEITLYNSWISAGRPSNPQCTTTTVTPTTSLMPSITAPAEQVTIWSEGNAKLVTTSEIQSKFDLVVTATKSSDGLSYLVSVKGTPKAGAAVAGQNLKLATLIYDTQKFTRRVSAEITKRSILASTSTSSTPVELITATPTPTNKVVSNTPAPTTPPTNCTLATVQPVPTNGCSQIGTFTEANASCTNGRTTLLRAGVCQDYAKFKEMAYNFCQSACGNPVTPTTSITSKPTTYPTPCYTTSYTGPTNMVTCDGGIAGTFKSFTVNCGDGYKQVMNAASLDQCWSSSQMTQVGTQICNKRTNCPVSTTPSPISMTPPTGIRCTGQCIISGDGRADPVGTTYPVGRTCYGIDRQCYVCGSNGQFTTSQTACATIPSPNPTTIASCVGQCKGDQPGTSYSAGKTCIGMDDLCYSCQSNGQWSSGPASNCGNVVTPTPTPCAPAPKCNGQLIHGDPRPGSGVTCPVYQCIPTPTPVCPPWNLLCRIVSTPTPTPTNATPTPCAPAPKCNGQLIVGDPAPGSKVTCPVYQCIPTPTPTPTCAAWNLFCRIRPSVTPTSFACPQNYSPVCGVDGRTYSNSCMASQAKVSVAYAGGCNTRPTPTPSPCPWWNLGCRIRPSVTPTVFKTPSPTPYVTAPTRGDTGGVACAALYAPVCSTDNVTYSNECEATKVGATIAYNGACNAVPVQQ